MTVRSFTTGKVAELLDVAPRTATQLIDSGELPGWTIGRDRRVSPDALIEYCHKKGIPLPDELAPPPPRLLLVSDDPNLRAALLTALMPPAWDVDVTHCPFLAGIMWGRKEHGVVVADTRIGRQAAIDVIATLAGESVQRLAVCAEDDSRPAFLGARGDVFKRPFDVALLVERITSSFVQRREE